MSPPNKSLVVVSTTKRKYQADYDRREAIEEHLNRNVEIMWELARYQEKSRTDEEEKLRMSRALLCKKEFLSLAEECNAEEYISTAHKCTTALGELSKTLSPGAARELLAGTFTPKSKSMTKYEIPRSTPTSTSRKEAAEAWSALNFPPSLHKPTYNIGCSLPAQVGIVTNVNTITNINTIISQGMKTESSATLVNDNHDTAEVINHSENSLQTKMSHNNDSGSGWMEVEDDMLSTPARLAKESRRQELEEARRAALSNLDPVNLS